MDKDLIMMILEKALGGESTAKKTGYEKYLGKNVHIRTVTMAYSGKVESLDSMSLTLSSACWIADSGRFSDYLIDTSKANEQEPFPKDVTISIGGVIDVTEIDKLPEGQK